MVGETLPLKACERDRNSGWECLGRTGVRCGPYGHQSMDRTAVPCSGQAEGRLRLHGPVFTMVRGLLPFPPSSSIQNFADTNQKIFLLDPDLPLFSLHRGHPETHIGTAHPSPRRTSGCSASTETRDVRFGADR